MGLAQIDRTEMVRNGTSETAMIHNTDDLRIKEIKELLPPGHVIREFPATETAATTVFHTRRRCSQDVSFGRSSMMTPSWNTAKVAMPAVVKYMWLSWPPTVATMERG